MTRDLATLIALLRGLVDQAESDWRRRHLPPPTREHPRPAPDALRGAQILEAVSRDLDAIGGQLRALPSPASPRFGAGTRLRLAEADAALVAHAEFLLALLTPQEGAVLLPEQIHQSVAHLRELAQRRAELLA